MLANIVVEHTSDSIPSTADSGVAYSGSEPLSMAMVPYTLPVVVQRFTGREQELQDLLDVVSQGAPVIHLYGPPGAGKTALAVKLAERLKYRYTDKQWYFDLSVMAPTHNVVVSIMSRIIWSQHALEVIPKTLAELNRIYWLTLQNQRALIILDNIQNYEDMLLLVPPPGSILLGIGWDAIGFKENYSRSIGLLSIDEACTILNNYASSEVGAFAPAIVRACGYLPLAIHLAGSMLAAMSEELNPADYCFRLQNEAMRLARTDYVQSLPVGLIAVLHLTYWRLSPAAALLFRQVAVFSGSFDKEALIAVGENTSEQYLEILIQFGLIQIQAETQRFFLHEQVRRFALSCLNANEEFAARLHHAAYYQRYLVRAETAFLQGGDEAIQGLRGYDAESHNILSGQQWTAERTCSDRSTAELCLDYLQSGIELRKLRLSLPEQIAWLESSIPAIDRLNHVKLKGWVLSQLGLTHLELGFRHRALDYCQQHQKHCQKFLSLPGVY